MICLPDKKVVELCLSPDFGGLEMYMLRVVRSLAHAHGGSLVVVAPHSKLEARLRAEGLPHRALRVMLPRFPLLAARRLAAWLDTEESDVIHVHWGKDLSLAALACRFAERRVRIVYTRQMSLTRPKRDWYHRLLYAHVNPLLAITRQLQEEARRFLPLPPERVQLLYCGVAAAPSPAPSACAALRARAGVPPGRFMVGLFGRIEPAKGQHVLVDAVGLLKSHGVHAVLFGEPMRPAHLEALRAQIVRLGLLERVYYYGFHSSPAEIMGCFDCIVLTTYNETFGLVLVEAMRAGVAVVGTAAGGVPEIIEDGVSGLLVPPGDPAALAAAIERLERDPVLRRRLAACGKNVADQRFNEENHFAKLLAWLHGDIESRP